MKKKYTSYIVNNIIVIVLQELSEGKRLDLKSRKIIEEKPKTFWNSYFINALKDTPEETIKKILKINPELLKLIL